MRGFAVALSIAGVLALVAAATAEEPAGDAPSLGKVPGNMVHYDAKGKRFSLSDWIRIDGEFPPIESENGPAVIVFGAHWCEPCKEVVKTLAAANDALDKARVHRIYVHVDDLDRSQGMSQKELRRIASEMAQKPDYKSFRMLLGGDMQEVQTWMADATVAALPCIVVVSKNGEIIARPGLSEVPGIIERLTTAPAN